MSAEDYDWHKASEKLPPNGIIVWVSKGGGSALLARWSHYRWENACSIRDLPFHPVYWQHLRLPDSPGPLESQF